MPPVANKFDPPPLVIKVRVMPRASKSAVSGETDGLWKVRIAAPPVDGAANTELIKLFAKALGIARSNIEIIGGAASRIKTLRISGMSEAAFRRRMDGEK